MRLLNVHSLQLEEFFHLRDPPPYAILSHTWDETEVAFQDLKSRSARYHRGFHKINFACLQAIEDGLQYIWIDSCCIDKSSSAELSEAINSMFHWYGRAAICYAFLSDVLVAEPQLLTLVEDGHFEGREHDTFFSSQLARSRWFTRGWTLQELIAPPKIEFFGSNWISLGSRDKLSRCISTITRIPENALGVQSAALLTQFSVAERMNWAALRETTRIEDTAYCLLGIFGVNMPLIYGERENAFRRLQEEIIKTSSDHSIFAWSRTNFSSKPTFSAPFLAPNPKSFYSERRVIQQPWFQYSDDPYAISNLGLIIELPVSTSTRGDPFCVLGCSFEDEPEGPIGLILKAWNSEQTGWLFGARFVVSHQQAEAAKANRKRLILNHSEPVIQFSQSGWLLAINRFVIKTNACVQHTYPKRYWNTRTKVVCFPADTLRVGAMSLIMQHGYLVVLFGAGDDLIGKKNEASRHSPWLHCVHVRAIDSFRDLVQKNLRKLLHSPENMNKAEISVGWKREAFKLSIYTQATNGTCFKIEIEHNRTQLKRRKLARGREPKENNPLKPSDSWTTATSVDSYT